MNPRFQLLSILLMGTLLYACIGVPVAQAQTLHMGDASANTRFLPLVGNQMCDGNKPESVFGVQVYSHTGFGKPYHAELVESGASWVRVPISWERTEPVDTDVENYNWTAIDNMLAIAGQGCLNVIATHRYNPSWAASSPEGAIYLHAMDDLVEYMEAVVERYDGDGYADAPGSPVVRYWELYNEPDVLVPEWNWGSNVELYALMLKNIYPAVKRANPQAQVLLGGLAYDYFSDRGGTFNRRFLDELVNADGADYFDVMNFHYFPTFAADWTEQGPGLLEKTKALRKKMDRLDLDKPIIVTEAGHFADSNLPMFSDTEIQMRIMVQLYTQAIAADVDLMIWFTLYDLTNYPYSMGLVTKASPPGRRPAFRAFQVAQAQLSNVEFVEKLSKSTTRSSTMEAYKFRDAVNERTIYVAWQNPVTTGLFTDLRIPARTAIVRSVMNESVAVWDGDDGDYDGMVEIEVGSRPIYIEVEWSKQKE